MRIVGGFSILCEFCRSEYARSPSHIMVCIAEGCAQIRFSSIIYALREKYWDSRLKVNVIQSRLTYHECHVQ